MLDQLDEVDMVKPFDRIINLLTPKRRWAQFSLGTMFVVVTGICVWLAFQVNRAHRQAVAVSAIRRMGGEVYYEYQYLETDGETNLTINAVPTAPPWLLNSLGEDFVYRAVAVTPKYTHFPGTFFGPALNHNDFSDRTDDALEDIGRLGSLRILDLQNTKVSDVGLAHLKKLAELRHLTLIGTQVSTVEVDEIQSALPSCRIIR
jgi:hypothetical protein